MIRRILVLPLASLLVLVACAQQAIPPEFSELKAEVTILEISKYLGLLQDGYVDARQRRVLSHEQFVEAVKADRALFKVWNRYIEIRRTGDNDPAMWGEILTLIGKLEGIAMQYVPGAPDKKPAALTGG